MTDTVSFSELIKSNVIKNNETSANITKKKKIIKCSQCPASVKIQTYGNAAKHIQNNDKGELVLYQDKAYYACTRPTFEGSHLCWRHSNAKDVLIFSDIQKKGSILTKDHPYFNKYRNKNKSTIKDSSEKYTIEVPNNADLIKKIEELINSYTNNEKKPEIVNDTSETVNPITLSTTITEEDLVEVNDHDGEDTTIINSLIQNKDDNESILSSESDSDGSVIEMEEIVTKKKYGCRSLGINDKMEVYDPDGDLLGILVEVDDSKAPIEHEGKNCIVSTDKEIDGIKYKKCSLSDRVYDYSTNDLVGKMSKKGELKPLKKK